MEGVNYVRQALAFSVGQRTRKACGPRSCSVQIERALGVGGGCALEVNVDVPAEKGHCHRIGARSKRSMH
eukprot:2430865-Rhodomonas_salina.1